MLELYYSDIANSIRYAYSKGEIAQQSDFHLHDRFEIYFFISGDVNYFIEKKMYPLKYGDLLIINDHEIHKPSFLSNNTYERITIHFNPSIPKLLGSPDFDLLHCFTCRPKGEQNKINLDSDQIKKILELFHKIENSGKSNSDGSDVLKLTYFIELLVFINRAFLSIKQEKEHPNVPEKLIPILDYIDKNPESDLSLEGLEQKFYIDRFYLSHLFKKSTGVNIHEYIILKRISQAKKLLSEGLNVTDTCQASGFNDYSNFIRIFRKTVGTSPGQFRKDHTG